MASGIWLRFRGWIQELFGINPQQSDEALTEAERDAQRYFDITAENMTAAVANTLATLAFGDADITISSGDDAMVSNTARVDALDKMMRREWGNAKRNVAAALGVGMIATIPYSVDTGAGRRIYTSTVTRDRLYITGVQGDEITQCVVLADAFEDADGATYYRWTSYSVEGGTYTIRNKATEGGSEIPLTSVERWAGIPEEVQIAGVERLPIGIFRCPTANRRPDDITGVPITFGCDATLRKIAQTFEDIETEFRLKKVRVMADRSLLRVTDRDAQGRATTRDLTDELFMAMGASDQLRMDIFDPALRESSYFAKLQQHFALLEKEIGVSRGILTDMTTQGATATEIRRAMYQTFCLLDDIHGEYQQYMDALMYGINVLFNYYGIEADSQYEISYDWSYALLEDTTETFNQLMQGNSIGAISNVEIRMFLHPDEDYETAAAKVADQKQNSLITNDFLGMVGNDTLPID